MAVIGAWAKSMFGADVGTIGTTSTFTKLQTFDPPQNVLALPLLRSNVETDDETTTEAYVSEFVDKGGKKSGKFMGLAAESCSSIVWSLYCDHSFNNPTRFIIFFSG